MEKDIEFLQKLLACLENVRLAAVQNDPQAIQNYVNESTDGAFHHLLQRDDSFWAKLFQFPARTDTVYECTALGGITYFVYKDTSADCFIFLGPMMTRPFSPADTKKTIERLRIPQNILPHLLDFCARLPLIPVHTVYRMSDLIVQFLTKKESAFKVVQIDTMAELNDYWNNSLQFPDEDIAQMRQTERRYEYSTSLTEAVKQGNLSLALYLMGSYTPAAANPARNPNPLRNAQNYCIVMNTQLRHALEGSGIHPTRIDALSNEIGMQIERLNSLSQIPEFTSRVIRQYCRLVQDHRYPGLRSVTHLAVSYIKDHLSENLTVKETAEALSINANYLSSLFHADMGMTFIDFVNRERANQAAALLKHTKLQIQQIAALVGYNNTSYFARQFKRTFGKTPHDYRHNIA